MTSPSDRERWERTAREPPRWDARNHMIAATLPPGAFIVDIGAGAQTLRDKLPPGCDYVAVDLVEGPGVIVCDLNAGEFPELPRRADVAVCSGVVEYLTDPGAFLKRLADLACRAVLSYAVWRPYQTLAARRRAGWVTDLTRDDLEALIAGAALRSRELGTWSGHLLLELWPRHGGEAALSPPPLDPRPDDWYAGMLGLRLLGKRDGHAAGPVGDSNDLALDLDAWIARQRLTWKAGRMAPGIARELEAEPGWCWGVDEVRFEQQFARFRAAGDAVPPDLVQWSALQRAHAKEGCMHPDRIRRLRAAGVL